ncbi:hypothetical protein M8C21_012009 [Ambrosia artemisiifolia]|uniref:Uncharacterized protein n=1 Tax=Ambrosia artemisiifolia TaxID=4212 RepID=A0AAD5CIP9_AMBAR|nr:hypothetical protein M8C21_012009 [Ambrosia artemisiifolia]
MGSIVKRVAQLGFNISSSRSSTQIKSFRRRRTHTSSGPDNESSSMLHKERLPPLERQTRTRPISPELERALQNLDRSVRAFHARMDASHAKRIADMEELMALLERYAKQLPKAMAGFSLAVVAFTAGIVHVMSPTTN